MKQTTIKQIANDYRLTTAEVANLLHAKQMKPIIARSGVKVFDADSVDRVMRALGRFPMIFAVPVQPESYSAISE